VSIRGLPADRSVEMIDYHREVALLDS